MRREEEDRETGNDCLLVLEVHYSMSAAILLPRSRPLFSSQLLPLFETYRGTDDMCTKYTHTHT